MLPCDVKHRLQTFPTLGNPPPFMSSIPLRPGRQALAPCSGAAALPRVTASVQASGRRQQQLGAVLITSLAYFPIFIPIFTGKGFNSVAGLPAEHQLAQ